MSGFVEREFGVRVDGAEGLVEVALRRNPRRAHLLVSTVLGKHIPTEPRIVHDTGLRLGALVASRLVEPAGLVIGYAETATGLGHCVAEALRTDYLHSTRRRVPGVEMAAYFEEPHSHATGHLLLPEDPALLRRAAPLVLVDDELSTGVTALNTITELNRLCPHPQYVIAALVDARSEADRARVEKFAARLGVPIDVVSLAAATVSWPEDFPARAARFVASTPAAPEPVAGSCADVIRLAGPLAPGMREGGRHGFTAQDGARAHGGAAALAARIAAGLAGERVLVLGTEELMYAPLLIAVALAELVADVRYSSTTRSPVLVLDEPGYPVRTRLAFPAADGAGERYAYNIAQDWSDIVLVLDEPADALVEALRGVCDRLHLAVLPVHRPLPAPLRGPSFGSYRADEVSWLLTDLSEVELEAPTEEREEAIQSGGAHYAESLPVEYQPTSEYQAHFAAALEESAARVAHAVGVVGELVLELRGPGLVLASLARAGTPVGILVRRWMQFAHGLDVPHYALSIVRGRGIDSRALDYLAARHDPATVMFLDGWTGKGAIARELAAAVDDRFDPELAVLADTGSCVSLFGTRADFLIPSACLNSTVSGLVSRTVLNPRLLMPGQYHGAKFYRALADVDASNRFLDVISARFADVAHAVATDWPVLRDTDRTPTWSGWAAVEDISRRYGIDNLNLVKPGVGETTRVLLRRVPWRILIRPDRCAELGHVLLLAQHRGVPVEEVPDLAYSCVGLIRPRSAG
ncbi:MAG: phosphoribosyltransferase [Actinomycetota bacterium]|nr:phosphoribosyltransferase [Actinomycetota bacterium]